MPRRYLIDVPGGEEEYTDPTLRRVEGDLNLLLNVMDQTIKHGGGQSDVYVDMLNHVRETIPDLKFPPKMVVWMGDLNRRHMTERDLFNKFAEISDQLFSPVAAINANDFVEGAFGVGFPVSFFNTAVVSIGYMVNTRELSDFMVKWHKEFVDEYHYPKVESSGGVVAIQSDRTHSALYKTFSTVKDFLPMSGLRLDIGDFSIGKNSNASEWFWYVKPLTPFEQEMVDDMFRKSKEKLSVEPDPTRPFHPSEEQIRNAAYTAIEHLLTVLSRDELQDAYSETVFHSSLELPSYHTLTQEQMILNIMEAIGRFDNETLDSMIHMLEGVAHAGDEDEPEEPEPHDDEPIMIHQLSRDGWIENFVDLLPRLTLNNLREVYGKISEYLENYPGDLPRAVAELPAVLPPHVPDNISREWVRSAFLGLNTGDMEEVFDFAWGLQRSRGLNEPERREMTTEGWIERIMGLLPVLSQPHMRVLYDLAVTYITHGGWNQDFVFNELPITLGGGTSREEAEHYIRKALNFLGEDDLENIYDTAWGFHNPEV